MDKNTQSIELRKIQLLGERAVLHNQLARSCLYAFAMTLVLFVIYELTDFNPDWTAAEDLFAFLMISSPLVAIALFLYSEQELGETAALVFDHLWKFHRERLNFPSPVIDSNSAAYSLAWRLLLPETEQGRELDTDMLQIAVLRTFKGQLLRLRPPLMRRESRKKLLAQYFAISQCRDETLSLRRSVLRSFLINMAVSFVVMMVLLPLLKVGHILPARDKVALYELETSLGCRTRAVRWLALAALEGDREAQYRLAGALSSGRDAERDYHEAVYWLWQGTKQFDERAMSDIAAMHEEGLGVRQDAVAAEYWRYKAEEVKAKRASQYVMKGKLYCPEDIDCSELMAAYNTFYFPSKSQREHEQEFTLRNEFVDASRSGSLEFMKKYLAQGGNINVIDPNGNTALLQAVTAGRTGIVQFLLQRGADKEILNYEGLCALSAAARDLRSELIKLLVESSADVNLAGRQGMTPLHWAVTDGNTDAARYLLAHGADINAKTKSGMTVLQLAGKLGRKDIAAMLREAGPKE